MQLCFEWAAPLLSFHFCKMVRRWRWRQVLHFLHMLCDGRLVDWLHQRLVVVRTGLWSLCPRRRHLDWLILWRLEWPAVGLESLHVICWVCSGRLSGCWRNMLPFDKRVWQKKLSVHMYRVGKRLLKTPWTHFWLMGYIWQLNNCKNSAKKGGVFPLRVFINDILWQITSIMELFCDF